LEEKYSESGAAHARKALATTVRDRLQQYKIQRKCIK
jgi:hypothetical protein